jgi:hypothetical protein
VLDVVPPAAPDLARRADQIGFPVFLLVIVLVRLKERSIVFGVGINGDCGGAATSDPVTLPPEPEFVVCKEVEEPPPPTGRGAPRTLCPCLFFKGDTRIDDCSCRLDTLAFAPFLINPPPM